MLSSKEVIERTNISRATLNNYIALGVLPKPAVLRPDGPEVRAPRLGYFPHSVIGTIDRVNALKKGGHSMAEIVELLQAPTDAPMPQAPAKNRLEVLEVPSVLPGNGLRLTLDVAARPAYMVNNRFELEWWNEEANAILAGGRLSTAAEGIERNLFKLLCVSETARLAESRDVLADFHLAIAKGRLPKKALLALDGEVEGPVLEELLSAYDAAEAITTRAMIKTEVNLAPRGEEGRWHTVYASFFREGIFFAFEALDRRQDDLLAFLSRRDAVIRELLRNRRPSLTPVAVLVADLQSSTKICAELPPEEYFELVNGMWSAMEPKLRRYYGTHGKHVGDGLVAYFLPQPDCNHVFNAVRCAWEMREAMREVSRRWRSRKNWFNDLKLNIGIHEGEEWFGTYQTPTHVEFTVLGDTINQAARLSDFAREGAVWVTKSVIGKLNGRERQAVNFGIRRRGEDGSEMVIPSTFSRISNLVDLDNPKNEKFRDIAVLPVTEVLDLGA